MRQVGCTSLASEALKQGAGLQQILKVRDPRDLPVGELRLAPNGRWRVGESAAGFHAGARAGSKRRMRASFDTKSEQHNHWLHRVSIGLLLPCLRGAQWSCASEAEGLDDSAGKASARCCSPPSRGSLAHDAGRRESDSGAFFLLRLALFCHRQRGSWWKCK